MPVVLPTNKHRIAHGIQQARIDDIQAFSPVAVIPGSPAGIAAGIARIETRHVKIVRHILQRRITLRQFRFLVDNMRKGDAADRIEVVIGAFLEQARLLAVNGEHAPVIDLIIRFGIYTRAFQRIDFLAGTAILQAQRKGFLAFFPFRTRRQAELAGTDVVARVRHVEPPVPFAIPVVPIVAEAVSPVDVVRHIAGHPDIGTLPESPVHGTIT